MTYFVEINNEVYSQFPLDLQLRETERQYEHSRSYRAHGDRMALASVGHDTKAIDDIPDSFKKEYQTSNVGKRLSNIEEESGLNNHQGTSDQGHTSSSVITSTVVKPNITEEAKIYQTISKMK